MVQQMGAPVRRFDFLFWLGREMVRNAENIEDMVGPEWAGGQYARGFGGTVETQRSPRARSVICGCWGSGSTDTATKRYVWGTYPGAAAHTRPWASTGFRERRIGRVLGRAAASLNHDPESQVYYVRNRTYNPVLGRWIQRDPIGYAGGINLYEYVGGATLGWADPDGAVAIPIPRTPASVEAIVVAALVAYFYYLAHRRTNVRCQPANVDRNSPCSFSDCSAGRLCGVVGSGRGCQRRPLLRGGRVCGCQAGGSGDER